MWLHSPKNILLLVGPPGTGKTYACSAMVDWLQPRLDNYRYYTEKEMMGQIYQAINTPGHDYTAQVDIMLDYSLLMFNDMGSMGFRKDDKKFRQEIWFAIVDALYEKQIPAVITTNLYEHELADVFDKRFVSRLFDHDNIVIDLSSEKDWRRS